MSTTATAQVDATSLDTSGISLSTAPASSNPRTGTAFNTLLFAAAQPVWFHPLHDGRFLMINSRVWSSATPIGGTPGAFSAYTEWGYPTWAIVDGPTGATVNAGNPVPMNTSSSGTVVVGGASRAQDSLWLLSSINGGTAGIVQRFSCSPNGSVAVTHEDLVPNGSGVVFDEGIQYDSPFLIVHGTDSSGHIYRARKPYAKVGTNKVGRSNLQTHAGIVGTQVGWEYYTGSGYSADPTEMAPVLATGGATWVTKGPMSFASYRNTDYATTVAVSGGTYTGQIWTSTQGRPWTPVGSPLALGASSDSSYLGGTVQFMGNLSANPAAAQMVNAVAGIPFVTSVRTAAGGGHILDSVWDICAIKG